MSEGLPPSWQEFDAGAPPAMSDMTADAVPSTVTPLFSGPLPWPDPIAFNDFDLPEFPVHALPATIARFVSELATATQTPIDLPAALALSALQTVTARRAVALIKPGYTEPLNGFVAVVLGPGERKSAALSEILAPIIEWDAEMEEESKPRVARSAQAFRLSEKRLAAAEANVLRCRDKGTREQAEMEAEELALEHAKLTIYQAPRMLADDCTPEALGSLLHAQGGRMAMMSAEGGIFSLLAGRYSDDPNLDIFLKAHSGDLVRVDRKGRAAEYIERPALTLGLAVQPGVIEKLAETPMFRSTGFLARFLYSMPAGRVGYRQVDPPPVSAETKAAYKAALVRMLSFKVEKPLQLRFTTLAYQAWKEFAVWLEPQLQEFEPLGTVRDWGSKLPGLAARLAGAFALVDGKVEIDEEIAGRAIEIAKYAIPHALAAFSAMGMNDAIADAKAVLRLIRRKHYARFTRRELHQALRKQERFDTSDKLDRPLELLCGRYFIRRDDDVSGAPGRPTERYLVHPRLSKIS